MQFYFENLVFFKTQTFLEKMGTYFEFNGMRKKIKFRPIFKMGIEFWNSVFFSKICTKIEILNFFENFEFMKKGKVIQN